MIALDPFTTPGDTVWPQLGRGGFYRNANGAAVITHPDGGKRTLIYKGASSWWPFAEPYDGDPIYGERGTWVHSLCDELDRDDAWTNDTMAEGVVLGIPADLQFHIAKSWQVFRKAYGIEVHSIEQTFVNDRYKCASNADRIVSIGGGPWTVGDIKTASGVVKKEYAYQLAQIAGSKMYDPTTGERTDWAQPIDATAGHIFWFPLNAALKADSPDDWPDWSLIRVGLTGIVATCDTLAAMRDAGTPECFTTVEPAADAAPFGVNICMWEDLPHTGECPRCALIYFDIRIGECTECGFHPDEFTTTDLSEVAEKDWSTRPEAAPNRHRMAKLKARYALLSNGDRARFVAIGVDMKDADAVEAGLNSVDPFTAEPEPLPVAEVKANTVPELTATTDEGDLLTDDQAETVRGHYNKLTHNQRQWLAPIATDAQRGGAGFGMKETATHRRGFLVTSLSKFAAEYVTDAFGNTIEADAAFRAVLALVVDDLAWSDHSIGAIVATLTAEQTQALSGSVNAVIGQLFEMSFSDDGRPHFNQITPQAAA
jgi:hypothetical protein